MTTRVLVLGGNFGGLTSALTVQAELGADVEVTVISPSDRFLFTPSLIWVPSGKRTLDRALLPEEEPPRLRQPALNGDRK